MIGARLFQARVDMIQAVRMSFPVAIEKIVHLSPAAGMQQIVLAHVVCEDLQKRAVEIGIDRIPHMQFQRLIDVDRDARG